MLFKKKVLGKVLTKTLNFIGGLQIQSSSVGDESDGGEKSIYLGSRHALWGATLQQHLLLKTHLPPQRLLFKVFSQVYRGRHTCSQQLVKAAL